MEVISKKEYNELKPFEKEVLHDLLRIRQGISLIVKHLEIINGFREKKKSLSTSQSEGTELPFKVPSANPTDKPCPRCKGLRQNNHGTLESPLWTTCKECKGTGKARL